MDYLKIILIIIAAVAAIVIIALIIAKSSEKNEYLQLKVNYGRLKKYEFTYEEYESSYNSTALDTCSNSTSDDYENIRKYYVVEYTKLDRVDSPNLAVMDITYAELHSVILKKA